MLSSCVVAGPQAADGPVVAGDSLQWVLANNGSVPWPAGTTLRLVGGPVLLCPVVEVPEVPPGQTVDVELEVQPAEDAAEVFYSLVTPDLQPFGEVAHASIAPREAPAADPQPVVAVLSSPMDGLEGAIEALQGEVKTVEWTLANVGHVAWPEDVAVRLIYNTPGFEHLAGKIEVPALAPGMTAHAGVSVLMPEREGHWKAMWAVTSPTHPEFGDVLLAEFNVSDFPFMEWMLAEEAKADSVSDGSSLQGEKEEPRAEQKKAKKKLSVAIAMQQHIFLGAGGVEYPDEKEENEAFANLGQVSGAPGGVPWVLELALTNDGAEAWPEGSALTCCFGTGLGCGRVELGGGEVPPGDSVLVQMELRAPEETPCQTAWVMTTSGQECFGPAMVLEVA